MKNTIVDYMVIAIANYNRVSNNINKINILYFINIQFQIF